MIVTKLGAIDIGSNSIRCLITNVIYRDNYTYYKKVSLVRLPIRLGQDVFAEGKITKATRERFMEGMKAYKHLLSVHGVQGYRAVATSAMREAKNGARLVRQVRRETGIEVEIIDGEAEANLIFNSKLYDIISPKEANFIYIDVGGGSTEISIIEGQEVTTSRSFKIGGVRVMNGLDEPQEWEQMRLWLRKNALHLKDKAAIGSGGNINKMHKMSLKTPQTPLTSRYLERQLELLNAMTTDDRITQLGLNTDRADIIVHALPIYMKVMDWANAHKIYVPKIGVGDGLIRDLYHREFQQKVEQV